MTEAVTRIAVTGGAGQIAYSLLFRVASGELLGHSMPIALHILDVPEVATILEGVKMELEDCAFPLLREVRIGTDPHEMFSGVHYAFLVGAKPRAHGMERKDLLLENANIFVAHGKALNDVADTAIRTLVVGNPCNTNCLIAIHNAPNIAPERFQAMMRLDQNRAMSMLAKKADRPVVSVTKMTIWGNHSVTQVPDYYHAAIDDQAVLSFITDQEWLEDTFINEVQLRGAEVIRARGKSSAASAASAAIDAMHAWLVPTPINTWFSTGVYSVNNSYGIDPDLVFSFPCTSRGHGDCSIVSGITLNEMLAEKLKTSEKELIEERNQVKEYLR